MRKMIRQNMQVLLMILLMQNGFHRLFELAWIYLEFPCFRWLQVAFMIAAGAANFCFILWIQKTD